MLLKIAENWINPDHVANVYLYQPVQIRIELIAGRQILIDVPYDHEKKIDHMAQAKELLDQIAMKIANNQTKRPASLPEAIAKARGNPEPPTSRVAFAATCKDGRHIVHPECTACECGYLAVSAFKDLRVFDVGIAPVRKRVVIHLLADDKIACGVSSGGASHNVEDVTCLECIDSLVIQVDPIERADTPRMVKCEFCDKEADERLVINGRHCCTSRVCQHEAIFGEPAKTAEFTVPKDLLDSDRFRAEALKLISACRPIRTNLDTRLFEWFGLSIEQWENFALAFDAITCKPFAETSLPGCD